ncbi:MAG: hypothetical protein D6689_11130 [Deltaproteobacteria bacterium]|nr:MAG: hypothetical protein D6689_11130 [Deltaproteobacteria bacterium]
MLEHVAVGQSRFMTPGVAPDPRGVLLGRFGLLVFPTLEGVVSWLRVYSAEASLDELLPSLTIARARTPLRSQEFLVRIPAISSYTMDRAARCARLVGGATFTGTSKHFVRYRDERSPYGYDAVDIHALPAGADVMVHGEDYTQTYTHEAAIAFETLLFRLSRRRVPGGDRLAAEDRADLLLVVERGLGDGVVRYLWRNRVRAQVGIAMPRGASAFDAARERGYWVARVQDVPQRILDLFIATPGIAVFRPVTPNAAVEVGYRHVIDLTSCASALAGDAYYVFWGGDRVDTLDGPLQLTPIEHLTRIDVDLDGRSDGDTFQVDAPDIIGVSIRLAASVAPPRHVVGALVPLERAAWVKKLVYVLPQPVLRGHRVAVTDRGVLLVAHEDIDLIPLGQLLSELAPGLLVPLGMEIAPRVAPDVLARTLGHGAGMLTVFPGDGPPFQIADSALQPLERRTLAKVEVVEATAIDTAVPRSSDPEVVNDPIGRFALWGRPRRSRRKALPPGDE